jgi:octaprenyl-diphosphate synthase
MGKETGTDLREGSITIPTIYTLNDLKGAKRKMFTGLLKKRNKTKKDIKKALTIIKSTGSIESSKQDAILFSDMAKKSLSFMKRNNSEKEMRNLIEYVLSRNL